MNDQDQEFLQESDQQSPIEEELIPTEGFLNHRLSLLHLDHRSMASTDAVSDHAFVGADTESYQVDVTDPSPPRTVYGNNTPLKRRCSSSTFSPPPQSTDAGYRRLVSEGYHVLQLPSAGNERATTVQQNAPSLRRCFSLNSNCNSPIPPAEISNRGTLALPENQTRRSLFPAPVNGSASTAGHLLPPPHPLARTASDPMRFSHLENPVFPTREKIPGPRTDPYLPRGLHGNGSGLDSTQESSSSKRLKRMARARKIRQQMKEWIDQMAEEEEAKINASKITSETDIIPTDQKVMEGHVGSYNNWGSSADETITNAEPEEIPQEELMEKEAIKEDELEADADIVKAKRVGECTFLEFKCRCGSGYSVGIIGQSCFYKLI